MYMNDALVFYCCSFQGDLTKELSAAPTER